MLQQISEKEYTVNPIHIQNILDIDWLNHFPHFIFISQRKIQHPALNQVVTESVVYIGTSKITQIRAIDNIFNGTGGYAAVTSGGLYTTNVTIRLQSSGADRGYNFTVDIYGH